MAIKRKRLWVAALALPAAVLLLLLLNLAGKSMFSKMPDNLGVTDGRLAACPDSPNCVSTQTTGDKQMQPWSLFGSVDETRARLEQIIRDQPRTKIVTSSGNYIHAEFTSLIFRFVDDVEFYIDEAAGVVHFRSASRVGYSDLGVNRKRMEKLQAAYGE